VNLAAPDSEPKLFTEGTLAATDRTGGDKTEVSSVQRALHSAFRTWAETRVRWADCATRRTLVGRSPPVCHDRGRGSVAAEATAVVVRAEARSTGVVQAETCLTGVFRTEVFLTVAIGAEALLTCR
jgi:hypothetical protein